MARVEDNGKFFRLPSDNRSLNYDKFLKKIRKLIKNIKNIHHIILKDFQ